MKYIRTKDELGIYIEKDNEYKDLPQGTYFKTWRGFYLHDDWRVADTIEELCDEFVVIGIFKNQIGCCCDTFNEAKELKDYVELPQKQIIYGAIWTDKGLIYVAKTNNKGELELI